MANQKNHTFYHPLGLQIPFTRPIIKKHDKFNVLRDDLFFKGAGTKLRTIPSMLNQVKGDEIVYAADIFGHGQLSLAIATNALNKKLTLFLPKPKTNEVPEVHLKTTAYDNVSVEYSEGKSAQISCYSEAKGYTLKNPSNRFLIPIGFNTPLNIVMIRDIALSLGFIPNEVWALAGSGTMIQGLRLAWPQATINAVSMGHPHTNIIGADNIYKAPEKPFEKAKFPPPYNSSPYYDAKIWQFVKQYGSEDALIWNVA